MDSSAAAEALVTQLGGGTPKLVAVFASRVRDHAALNRALRERLGRSVPLVGASTHGEIDNEGIHQDTVVVGALYGDLDVGVGLGKGLSKDAMGAGAHAMNAACQALGVRPKDLDTSRYVGVVIDDGYRGKKEELLLGALDRNQSLVLVGGGAADREQDPAKQSALVHADDEVETDAVAVALVRTDAPWAALRSHWYLPTDDVLTITKVDETCMRALEIDGKPAAARYAEILGCSIDDLSYPSTTGFAARPTALKVGREHFMRAPWKVLPDGSILFANLLEEGSELEIMRLGDMVELTRRFLEKDVPARVPRPGALLAFHCSGRYWMAQVAGKVDALARTFSVAPPCAGFNVGFEIYCGFHINSTLTALAFGSSE